MAQANRYIARDLSDNSVDPDHKTSSSEIAGLYPHYLPEPDQTIHCYEQ